MILLISIIFIFGTWQTVTYAIRPLKSITQLNFALFIAFTSLGFGIFFDCIRTLFFMFSDSIWVYGDEVCYYLKIFLLFVGVSAILRIISLLNKQSGQKNRHETNIRYFYIAATVIISILNFYFHEKTNPVSSGFLMGFYTYQISPYLYLLILILYIPLIIYLSFKIRVLLGNVKKQILKKEVLLLGLVIAALINERNLNIAAYLIFDPIAILFIEFSIIAAISIIVFILSLKFPNLIDDVSAFFNLKAIYLLRKHGGNILFEMNFKSKTPSTPDRLLMGGFLYAISSGLEEAFHVGGEIKKIKVGETTLLFEYGDHVYGLLFVSERVPFLHHKLKMVIQKVEENFTDAITQGEFADINYDQIEKWILESFQ